MKDIFKYHMEDTKRHKFKMTRQKYIIFFLMTTLTTASSKLFLFNDIKVEIKSMHHNMLRLMVLLFAKQGKFWICIIKPSQKAQKSV